MAERTKALVEKELLQWARASAALSLEAASKAAHVPLEKIEAWERGEDGPSIPELKKLAGAYKRPLSVFFLPEPPKDFQALRDFRRLTDLFEPEYSRALAYEIRAAQERRAVAIDLLDRVDDAPPAWTIDAKVGDDPETVAERIRNRLNIPMTVQSRWSDPAKAFRAWRDAIEASGVLVSVLGGAHHGVPLKEVRGFALAERPLPMIVVNGKDRTNGKIFTLMHELAHVALGVSAIENEVEPGNQMPAPVRTIETFCNKVAAAVLMPRTSLLNEPLLAGKTATSTWNDAEIGALAQRYCVSREALLIRLSSLRLVADDFVRDRRRAYAKEYAEIDDDADTSGGFAPYPTQVISHLGRAFARLVLQSYHNQSLTLSTASGYLGTQAKHVGSLEKLAFNVGGN